MLYGWDQGLLSPPCQPLAPLRFWDTPMVAESCTPALDLGRGVILTPDLSPHCQQLPQRHLGRDLMGCTPLLSSLTSPKHIHPRKNEESMRSVGHYQTYQQMHNGSPRKREEKGTERIVEEIMAKTSKT